MVKKLLSALTLVVIIGVLFTSCVNKDESGGNTVKPSDVAISKLQGCELNEEQMLNSINSYFDAMNQYFDISGDDIVSVVTVNEDGTIVVSTERPEIDEKGERTGKTVSDSGIFQWENVSAGFAYLYENGIVDLEGNVLFSVEDLMAAVDETGASSDSAIQAPGSTPDGSSAPMNSGAAEAAPSSLPVSSSLAA